MPSCLVPVLSPVGQDLDLVPRGHEGVEANDEVGVTLEQVGDPVYNAWRVDSVENRDKIKILFTMGLKFGFFPTLYMKSEMPKMNKTDLKDMHKHL